MARQQASAEDRRVVPAIMNQDSQQEEPRRPRTKLGKDVAESELRRFMSSMRLIFTVKDMDAENRDQFDLNKKRIINALLDGRLVIDQDGVPVYSPRDSDDHDPIKFPRPKGGDFMQADLIKANHNVTKTVKAMAATTHQTMERYQAMESTDFFVCQAIHSLYMAGE